MTIICPKCAAQHDVQASLIPPSGMMLRCPACLHTFPVNLDAGAPVELGPLEQEEEFTPPEGVRIAPLSSRPPQPAASRPLPPALGEPSLDAELPVPKRIAGRIGQRPGAAFDPAPRQLEAADLPAPKRAPRPPDPVGPPLGLSDELDILVPPPPPSAPVVLPPAGLPAPHRPPRTLPDPGTLDLPAPLGPAPPADLPAPVGPQRRNVSDLPAPVGPARGPDLLAPVGPQRRNVSDLPAPVGPPRALPGPAWPPGRGVDLPAPVGPAPLSNLPAPAGRSRAPDLLEPLAPASPLGRGADLPAPVLADLPTPVAADLPIPVAADLPSPVMPGLPEPVMPELPEPVGPNLPAPILGDLDLDDLSTLSGTEVGPPPRSTDSFDEDVADQLTRPIEPEAEAEGAGAQPAEKRRSRRRSLLIAAGALSALLLAGGGAAFYALHGRRPPEVQERVEQAVRLLGDDLYSSFRKAADQLAELSGQRPRDAELLGLLAQAHLGAARAGAAGDLGKADGVLGRVEASAREHKEVQKARAVRDLLAGKVHEARPLLQTHADQGDALAAVYLGWAELRVGQLPAAEKAFRAALSLDKALPAAQLGLGQVRQRLGDKVGAGQAYEQVLRARPQHFTAAAGKVQATQPPDALEAALLTVLNRLQASAAPRELAEAYTLLGTQALAQSRRKDAEDRLRKALAADPSFVAAQVPLARLLCDQGKADEAAAMAQRAVAADGKNLEAQLVLVRALLLGKRPLDAGHVLAAAAKLAPKDARVLYWQGRREEEVAAPGSDDKAAELYRKAVQADPRYLDAYIALSRVLTRQGKATDALASLRQVAAQAQNDPQLAAALGDAYLSSGDLVKGEEMLRLALGKQPDLLPVRMNLALALEGLGRLAEADRELAEVAERSKGYPGLSERRARLLLKQGRYEEAEAMYLRAAAEPGASAALRLDAASYNLKSHESEAEALVTGVLKEDPRSARAHTLLSLLRLQQQNLDEAALHAESATRIADLPEAHLAKGMVLVARGLRTDAIASLAAARRAPVEATARVLHARQLAAEGQYSAALEEITAFLQRHRELLQDRTVYRPGDAAELVGGAYLLWGDLMTLTQREGQALKAYELATQHLPRSGEVAARHGRGLYNAGKRQPAIRELTRALQLGGDQAPYALEVYLLLGDSYREGRRHAEALRAYQKWLQLAPADAPERPEVERHVQALETRRR